MLAPYTLFLDRFNQFQQGHLGVMSLRHKDGRFIFQQLPFRSGLPGYGETDFERGRSPIPRLDKIKTGELFLHIDKINKNGFDNAIPQDKSKIGWFVPIGDDKNDAYTIEGYDGIRTAIGIHGDHNRPGTAGCPGFEIDEKYQEAEAEAFLRFVNRLAIEGYSLIPIKVV